MLRRVMWKGSLLLFHIIITYHRPFNHGIIIIMIQWVCVSVYTEAGAGVNFMILYSLSNIILLRPPLTMFEHPKFFRLFIHVRCSK